jgi:hypothetical protein
MRCCSKSGTACACSVRGRAWKRACARNCSELGFRHRIVAAPNPHAARVLANVHDGIAFDEHSAAQRARPVAAGTRGIAEQVAFRAVAHGCAQVAAGVRAAARCGGRRFPKTVLDTSMRARRMAAPLASAMPPEHFEGRIEFEDDVESSQALLFPLRRLTQDLAAFLSGRDGGVQRFTLVLEHERCAQRRCRWACSRRSAMRTMCSNSGADDWSRRNLPAPVRGFAIGGARVAAVRAAAADLFETRAQQDVPWPQLRERLRCAPGRRGGARHRPCARASPGARRDGGQVDARRAPRPGWLLPHVVPCAIHALRVLAGPSASKADGGTAATSAAITTSSRLAGPARLGLLPAASRGTRRGRRISCCTGGSHEPLAAYAELHCLSNFTFQRGASSAQELFERAKQQGYAALAITDECTLAGIVRRWKPPRRPACP